MTQIVKIDAKKITYDGFTLIINSESTLKILQKASQLLHANFPVAFPTETVYGLGASCLSDEAVQAIYKAKNRPADNPLIIHVANEKQISEILGASIPAVYRSLVDQFWPGPLTILLPLPDRSPISTVCTLGQSTFGVRLPSNPVARALIETSNLPLAAPSANASTKPSCTTAQHTYKDLEGRIPLILDGGATEVGVESTVVDGLVSPPQILRPGGITIEQIRKYGGPEWQNVVVARPNAKDHEKVRTPGMKYRHYSPQAKVVLFAPDASHKVKEYAEGHEKVALLRSLTWDQSVLPDAIDLPLGTSPAEVSHNLFTKFRDADASGASLIVVEAIPLENEGLAVMNRMNKAASEVVL